MSPLWDSHLSLIETVFFFMLQTGYSYLFTVSKNLPISRQDTDINSLLSAETCNTFGTFFATHKHANEYACMFPRSVSSLSFIQICNVEIYIHTDKHAYTFICILYTTYWYVYTFLCICMHAHTHSRLGNISSYMSGTTKKPRSP